MGKIANFHYSSGLHFIVQKRLVYQVIYEVRSYEINAVRLLQNSNISDTISSQVDNNQQGDCCHTFESQDDIPHHSPQIRRGLVKKSANIS